jgi:PEP-CTERM motif
MKTTHPVLRASAMAVGFALASMAAQAQTTTSMQATGTYNLNNEGLVSLVDTWNPSGFSSTVDVLSFPGTGVHTAGLHSYGSTTGNFGSRSSGSGIYDVTGSFKIVQSFTNTTTSAGRADFNFYITPGMLATYAGSAALTDAQFVKAGISFDVKLTRTSSTGLTSTVFGSAATLQTNAAGTTYLATGDTTLYTGAGTSYTIKGGEQSVNLGVINAGETIDLSYELKTFASGVSSTGQGVYVPPTTYVVPAHWVSNCYVATDTPSLAASEECLPTYVPERVVNVDGYTTSPGTPSGSHANAGDPFSINLDGTPNYNAGNRWVEPAGFTGGVVLAPVPEPGTWGLMALGLGAVGFAARKRKAAAV